MPSDSSFDVVSRVDPQELDNALTRRAKRSPAASISSTRFASIESDGKTITVLADDELKLRNVIDHHSVQGGQARDDLKAFGLSKDAEAASGSTLRRRFAVRAGIPKDKSKPLIDAIKSSKLRCRRSTRRADSHLGQVQGRPAKGAAAR